MKIFQILILLNTIVISAYAQRIVINEVQPKNITTFLENCSLNECPDWIELHNTTSTDIDISGYFLSDDPDNIRKWQVPTGTIINANGFLMLFGKDTFLSPRSTAIKTNFNLSSNGETLILSDRLGVEIQQLIYPSIQNDISYGRLSDGSYSIMSIPSPRAINPDIVAFEYLDSNLTLSIPSGIFTSSQTVELEHTGVGSIYYTLDGSTPNTSSIPYTGPISITTNTVLKAIVIENANSFSLVENRSYIIGANHELPVVLLTSDNSFRNSSNNKEVINGRVEFNFIEVDGTTVINQYANFRASGKTSRNQPQLNGKVEASKLYGDGDFDYKMYPYKDIDEFDSFLFRNGSQDWGFTHLRDAFISRLIGKDNLTNFPFEGYRPAVLYVNAKYQGVIDVKEDDDNNYITHNFNLDKGEFNRNSRRNFIVPDGPLPIDRMSINSVINFNNYTNINFLINYTELNEFGFKWWEDLSGKTGQRYHYFMHDYDATYGLRGQIRVDNLLNPMRVSSFLNREIDANPAYRSESLQFIAAALNHLYNTERALRILNEMEATIESEIPAHSLVNVQLATEQGVDASRSPFFTNLTEWKQNVEDLRTNISSRIDSDIFNRIQTEYSLDTPIQVSYASSNINQGFIRVHEIKIQDQTATGTYFSNIPLKLTAEALPGFRFVRWEGDAIGTTTNIAPTFSSNASVTAIFEAALSITNDAVINEVQGKNDSTIADENGEFDDWIEIYNPSSIPINLAGFYFSDNLSEPLKWQIPDTDASKTTVPANGYLLLWADNDLDQGENHLGFKLKGSDQVIVTYPDGVTEKQRIEYNDIDTDESFGADMDGAANFIVFTSPTPNATNNGNILSIDEVVTTSFNKRINIFPNPTTSELTIVNNQKINTRNLVWKLYTINGNLVLSGTGNKVFMKNLSNGLYFITINGITLKIIKE